MGGDSKVTKMSKYEHKKIKTIFLFAKQLIKTSHQHTLSNEIIYLFHIEIIIIIMLSLIVLMHCTVFFFILTARTNVCFTLKYFCRHPIPYTRHPLVLTRWAVSRLTLQLCSLFVTTFRHHSHF